MYATGVLVTAVGVLLLNALVLHLALPRSASPHVYDAATFGARPENALVFPSATVLDLEAAPPKCDPDAIFSQQGHWTQAVVARRLATTATIAEVRAWYSDRLEPRGFVKVPDSPDLYREGPNHTVDNFAVGVPANAAPRAGGKNIFDVSLRFTTKSGGCGIG